MGGGILRRFPFFEYLDSDFLTALCGVGQTKRACIGDIVVSAENAANEMYWVVRGEVAALRQGQLVNTLKSEDWFGELSLFFPGCVRTATMRCETHCEFLVLHHDAFHEQIRKFPY